MSLEQQAVKSVFWVGVAKTAGQIISWGITLVLIRILSPDAYGLMGMALAYKLFVSIFFDMSIGEAVLQKKDLTDTDVNTAFWICFIFASVLYAVTWFAARAWAHFFSSPELVSLVRVIGLSLFFLSIKEIPNRLMARDFEFKKRSFCEMVSGIVSALTCLILALNDFGVWSLILGELNRDFVLMAMILYYRKWYPGANFSFSSAKQMLAYGLPVTGHYLLDYFSNRLDIILIGKLLGQTVLGYYTVAISLSRMPVNKGVFIIQGVVFPLFSKLQDNISEFARYYYMVIYLISLFCFPVFLGMYSIAEELIVVVLSPKWMPSLFPFKMFCLLGILISYKGILLVMLKARGKTRPVFLFSVFSAIFLPMSFLILSKYGLKGTAIAWIVVYPFLFAYLCYHLIIDIQVSFRRSLGRILPALSGSIIMSIVIAVMKATVFRNSVSIFSMSACIIVGVFVYIGYFCLFFRSAFSDIHRIWKTLKG